MTSQESAADFTKGLSILLLAQLLSAFMGAYVEDTYAKHGASWMENLFYSHFLGLPFFLPLSGVLRPQYSKLSATPPLSAMDQTPPWTNAVITHLPETILHPMSNMTATLPQGIAFLLINAITQLACISGVNLLSAKSSAVTVTIVLNIRKLVSFIFSTLLFGHELNAKMMLGATLVFGSGALYGWETSVRIPRERARAREQRKKK